MHQPCFLIKLREAVYQFAQKELEPFAADIDRTNDFPGIRVDIVMAKKHNYLKTICKCSVH